MSTPRKPRKPVVKSLTAAAKRITGRKLKRAGSGLTWSDEVWKYYTEVGELHYLAGTVANAMSMVELFVAKKDPETGGWERIVDDNDPAMVALDALAGDSPTGMSEMLRRFGLNLFVGGDAYLVGHPAEDDRDGDGAPSTVTQFIDRNAVQEPGTLDLESLCWKVYSAAEVRIDDAIVKVAGREFNEAECVVVRVWRPHPRDMHFADSPVRAAIPILRELVALTMYVSAILDSRFAGAGIVWMPEGASVLGGTAPEDSPDVDPFIVDVMDAMMTPITNRDAASSLVPIFVTLPDEIAWQPEHMSFASPLDDTAKDLRDEAIRRLALSLDAPPEVLTGMGDTSHWSAWLVAEDMIKLHVLPPIGLIRDALVREYLRPVLEANGITNPQDYTIEADASALTLRPNRSTEAMSLFDKGLITSSATREAMGFGEEDAPEAKAKDEAVERALEMITQAPSLAQDPGLTVLTNQIRQLLGIPTVEYDAIEGEPADEVPADPIAEPPPADENPAPVVEPGPPSTEQPGEAAA